MPRAFRVAWGLIRLPLRILEKFASNIYYKILFKFFPQMISHEKENGSKYSMADNEVFLTTWALTTCASKVYIRDVFKQAIQGYAAPDFEVTDLNSGLNKTLLSYAVVDVPLVLNFGSCT